MHAARTDIANAIDFSAILTSGGGQAMCRHKMIQYIRGVRGPRQDPVSFKQIRQWFGATPEDFLHETVNGLITEGKIRIVRTSLSRHRPAYRYEIT